MKTEWKTFFPIFIFFVVITPAYFFLGRNNGHVEWAGVLALALTTLMVGMITGYLAITSKMIDLRPEDRKEAEIIDGAGDVGFFPPSSIWPFWCALMVGLIFLGPVFGWWLTIIGAALGAWALAGWCYQYYRGEYQH